MADQVSDERPKALFIAPTMPSDSGNGLAMRIGFLLDSYAKRFAVDLAVAPVAGGTKDLTPFVRARTRRAIVLPVTAPDTHFGLIARVADLNARLVAFRQYGRPSITSLLREEVSCALRTFAGEACYDLVHVSRLYLASLVTPWTGKKGRRPCLVLDCDEDDVSVYRRFARLHRSWGRNRQADWARAEAEAFKSLAAQQLPCFDLLLAAADGEAKLLRSRAGVRNLAVIPNLAPVGTGVMACAPVRQGPRDVLFVGNMGYLPNIDAAIWFATRIWPRVRAAVPFPLRFVIAGHGAPRKVRNIARRPDIVLVGGFENAAPLFRTAALAVIPVRAGGGTRIKLLESAKFGVPVVATKLGAEGSGFRSGQELLLADTECGFAAACARLLTDWALASRLAARAQSKLRHDFDAKRLAARLLQKVDASIGRDME